MNQNYNNSFIVELDWEIDFNQIEEVADLAYSVAKNPKYSTHFLDHFFYMKSLREKYPILGGSFNIYRTEPYGQFATHVDGKRLASVNIPVSGHEESITTFYAPTDSMTKTYNERSVWFAVDNINNLQEVFNFSLKQPTLFNSTVPHSMRNGSVERVIISWGLQTDFETAKQILSRAKE